MEGILAELERLRTEVEELRASRDHWMRLWQQVTTELLRRTPPSTIQLPGGQAAAVLNILDLGKQADDVEGLPTDVPTMDEISAEVREVRRERAKRKGLP
jgi:hypothetical protein